MFDEPTRRAAQEQPARLRRRLRRPRRRPQPDASRRARSSSATSTRSWRNLSDPRTELPALLQGARRRRADRRAGLEDQRAPVHRRWPTRSTRSRATRRRCRTRSPSSPPTLRRRAPRRCASSARSSSTPPRSRATSTRRADELRGALPTVNSRAARSARRCSGARSRSTTALQGTLGALRATSSRRRPRPASLRGLTATVDTLQPQLRYLGPFVTVCNSWNYFWTFAAEHFSAPDDTGSLRSARCSTWPPGSPAPTRIGSPGANEFAHGKGALPGSSATSTCTTTSTAPAVDEQRQRRLRRRPDRLHPGLQPAARHERQGRPLPGAPSTERFPITRRAWARPTRSSTARARASA